MENKLIPQQGEKQEYYDIIDNCHKASTEIYNAVGWLRDSANMPEKVHANKLRGLLNDVWNEFEAWKATVHKGGRSEMML